MTQHVKLISHTVSLIEDDLPTLEDLVAYVARVSNPANQNNTKTSRKLIEYLIKHKHWSPFEMADACVEIVTTRDIARQILRHRSFSFQEFSQRYAKPKDMVENPFMLREARLQDHKNRQNSIEIEDPALQEQWLIWQRRVIAMADKAYQWAIDNGIAKEQARVVLPEGLTMSRIYMKGSLRSWLHYIELRTKKDTQKEHREIAEKCALALAEVFPMVMQLGEE